MQPLPGTEGRRRRGRRRNRAGRSVRMRHRQRPDHDDARRTDHAAHRAMPGDGRGRAGPGGRHHAPRCRHLDEPLGEVRHDRRRAHAGLGHSRRRRGDAPAHGRDLDAGDGLRRQGRVAHGRRARAERRGGNEQHEQRRRRRRLRAARPPRSGIRGAAIPALSPSSISRASCARTDHRVPSRWTDCECGPTVATSRRRRPPSKRTGSCRRSSPRSESDGQSGRTVTSPRPVIHATVNTSTGH